MLMFKHPQFPKPEVATALQRALEAVLAAVNWPVDEASHTTRNHAATTMTLHNLTQTLEFTGGS